MSPEIHVTAADDHIGELADGVVAVHYAVVGVVVQVLHGGARQAVHSHSQHLENGGHTLSLKLITRFDL